MSSPASTAAAVPSGASATGTPAGPAAATTAAAECRDVSVGSPTTPGASSRSRVASSRRLCARKNSRWPRDSRLMTAPPRLPAA